MKDLRPCIANEKPALFHTFEQYSEIVPPSVMVGGHNGGVIAEMFAIVEYEDGTVGRVRISSLKFTDKVTEAAAAPPQQKPQRRKSTQKINRRKHILRSLPKRGQPKRRYLRRYRK